MEKDIARMKMNYECQLKVEDQKSSRLSKRQSFRQLSFMW